MDNMYTYLDVIIPQLLQEKLGLPKARLLTGVSACFFSALVLKRIFILQRIHQNNQKRSRKQKNRQQSLQKIKEKCKYLKTEDVNRIVQLSLSELQAAIKSKKLRPTEILSAYQAKALEAHSRTNCLEEFIIEAEKWAEKADQTDGEGQCLHGIPISLKVDVSLKGYDSSYGVIARCEMPRESDAVILQVLRKHGAIPFCRTNVPQFLLSFETSNTILGATCNPYDTTRISGGSSGGESALVASGGSILGIGSDIGGSIRGPCAFTGLCGFKATASRISKRGIDVFDGGPDSYAGETVLQPCWGPLGRDMDSVVLISQLLLDGEESNKLDPIIVPMPFNQKVFNDKRRLKIGYFCDNGVFPSVPSSVRAVQQAVKYMETQGHTIVQWLTSDFIEIEQLLFDILYCDGTEGLDEILKYENLDESVDYILKGRKIPQCLRPLVAYVVKQWNPGMAHIINTKWQRTAGQYMSIASQVKHYRRKIADEWREKGLDAVICPAFAFPAPPLKSADLCMAAGSYTMVWNVLDFPAGIVRMTTFTEEDEKAMKSYPNTHPFYKKVQKAVKGATGLPVPIQVVALNNNDEMCLRVMSEVEKAATFATRPI